MKRDEERPSIDDLEKEDPIRKILEESWSEEAKARSALDRLLESEVPIDRRLAEAGFEPISDNVMRLRCGDTELTVRIRPDDTLEFHTSVPDSDQKAVSLADSRIVGIAAGHGGEPGLRLANDWMDYTLTGEHSSKPVDVVLRRPVTAADVGITPITPHTEPTGFVRGGDNPTSRIEQLTEINGYPLDDLERWMRPFDLTTWDPAAPNSFGSVAGYLGTHDSLRQTLARDNDLVRNLGLSHTDLAQAIHVDHTLARRYGVHSYSGEGGHTYTSERTSHSMGPQRSPFRDNTSGMYDSHATNTTTGASVNISELGSHMIERYGFYQGLGTSYRSAPEDIISTFGHLLDRGGGPERLQQVLTEVNTRHGWHHPFDP
ncbi:MAG: hypothetical protein HOQ44_11470 [Nocardia sp.]|nr:hypothetical protein [Nocardia sp.]